MASPKKKRTMKAPSGSTSVQALKDNEVKTVHLNNDVVLNLEVTEHSGKQDRWTSISGDDRTVRFEDMSTGMDIYLEMRMEDWAKIGYSHFISVTVKPGEPT